MDEAGFLVSKAVVKGYRPMPFVRDNPQWTMFELLDSFGSHERVLDSDLRTHSTNILPRSTVSHTSAGDAEYTSKTTFVVDFNGV